MKKIFTLMFALLSVTSIFATDAQDMASEFKGSANFVAGSMVNMNVDGQTITFNANAADNTKSDMTLSDVVLSVRIFTKTYTITMKAATVEGFTVTKNGNSYSLDDHSFNLVINNGTADATVTAKVASSDINIAEKKATLVLNVTDLPSAMTTLGIKSATVTYSLTLDHSIVTGINEVTANGVKADNGKFIKNGKLTIIRNGAEYSADGKLLK